MLATNDFIVSLHSVAMLGTSMAWLFFTKWPEKELFSLLQHC